MWHKYTFIDFIAMLFFLCMNVAICVGASQLHGSIIEKLFLLGAAIFLVCSYFKLGRMRFLGIKLGLLLFGIACFSYIYTGTLSVFRILLFVLIARGLTYKKIITYNNVMLMIVVSLLVLSSMVGITDIYWHFNSDKISYQHVVYVLGFDNPNTPPVIIFAMITGYNLLRDYKIKLKVLLLEFIITLFTFYLFQSRTELVVMIIYLLALFLLQQRLVFASLKYVLWIFQYLFLIGTVFTLYIAFNFYIFDSSWQDINLLLSGRLFLWQSFIETYGVQLFGNNMTLNTDPLDNGFMYLLIYYGVSMLVIYNYIYLYISRYAYKTKNIVLFLTIIAYELYCFGESTPLFFNYSPVLLYFSSLVMNGKKRSEVTDDLSNYSTV